MTPPGRADALDAGPPLRAAVAPAPDGPRPFRPTRVASLLCAALLVLLALSTQWGAVPIGTDDWWAPLRVGSPFSATFADAGPGAHVLWNLRVPRALLAIAVGAALGLCGSLTQGLFRNPMADPGLLGVTSGAACAVALTLTLFSQASLGLPPALRLWLLPGVAFFGALGVCALLDGVARWLTPGSIAGLLLTGLALNALTMAVVGLCSTLATDEQLRNLSFWTLGSLAGASWPLLGLLVPALVGCAWAAQRLAPRLNALALGEAAAAHVGIEVSALRLRLIAIVALLSALAVAFCGLIGFIGLMAPHLVRSVAGADQRRLLPLSMLAGALLLLTADTAARTLAIPSEIPVGIFTALIGAPAFLLVLRGVTRSQGGRG